MTVFDGTKQRGSVEVILLIIVIVAMLGLVAWRVMDNWKTDTEPKKNDKNSQSDTIKSEELDIRFRAPKNHGGINITNVQSGDFPSVTLVSEKLQKADYSCEGENSGEFGTLSVVNLESNGPGPQYTTELNDKTYGFTNGVTKTCYSTLLLKEFRKTVPQAIIDNLKTIK